MSILAVDAWRIHATFDVASPEKQCTGSPNTISSRPCRFRLQKIVPGKDGMRFSIRSARKSHAGARRFAIECYPGVFQDELSAKFSEGLKPVHVFRVRDCYKSPGEIEGITSRELTDDPVFGRLSELVIEDFIDPVWRTFGGSEIQMG
jgi:hypothetical protein